MDKSKPIRDNKPKPNEASGENSSEALSLPRELQEILPTIPANQRPKLVAGLERLIIGIRTTYSGPLPPADAIREYNETIPNGGDRLMSMAENQMAHRHLIDLFSRLVLNLSSIEGEATLKIPKAGTHFYCVTDFVSQPDSVLVPEDKVPLHASDSMLDYYSHF